MKFHFLKFLRPDVARNYRRLLSTAVARDTPIVTRKPATRLPKSVRKAMVIDFVNKYRALNAGKFPSGKLLTEQVGGSWYTIRPILQELKHNSKLSGVVTADNNSVVGPASHRIDISAVEDTEGVTPLDTIRQDDGSMLSAVEITSDTSIVSQTVEADQISVVREVVDCQVTRTSITESAEVSAETGSSSQEEVETDRSQLDTLSMNMTSSLTEVASPSDTRSIIDLEFKKTSPVGALDKTNTVEKSSSDETVKASASEKSEVSANSSCPSDTAGSSVDTRCGDGNKVSSPASVSDGYSRETTREKTQEQEAQGTLWGNLKSMASRVINSWRKT